MTAAPKHPKKSAAQIKAGQAYAAGGRAAQAKTRAAAIKKTGKPPARSKAQKAATQKWASAGRSAQAAAKSGKKVPAPTKKAALPLAHHQGVPVLWIAGCTDGLPVCYATAIANHLLAVTRIEASDAEILKLHSHAGGDGGSTLDNALEAAAYHGLAGVRLTSFGMADEILPGMVVGVQTRRGYHAVLSHEYGIVSWGLLLPRFGEPQEAWILEWDDVDGPT